MRIELALYLGGLCLVCQGCSPLGHAARTTIFEPTEFPRRLDDLVDGIRNRKLAEAAWDQFQAENADDDYSCDFALGFKAGYADFLYAGGTGAPPPVPPRYYWRPEFESPQGHIAIRDWFEGFRRGAAIAKQTGYRELVTLPSSVALPSPVPPAPQSPAAGTLPEPVPPHEVLPPPRKVSVGDKQRAAK